MSVEKQSFEFFDAGNVQAKQQREELAFRVLDAALEWLGATHCAAPVVARGRHSRSSWCAWAAAGGEVAIFDATNTTRHRRLQVLEHCRNHAADVQIVFIESICDDARVGASTCSRLLSSCA